MGLLPCPLPCSANQESASQSYSHSNPVRSESSNSSFLSSQPSLPSVPSLTPPSSQLIDHQISADRQHCLAILRGNSSYICSLALAGNSLYSGFSNSEIRAWSRHPSSHTKDSTLNTNVVATSSGAVKCLVSIEDKLFSAHQDCKIRVWRIDNVNQKYVRIATLPTMNDRFLRLFSAKNYVQVRRHKKCTWVHHVDTVSVLAVSRDRSLLYSASWDRTFKVWRSSDFRCLESIANAHEDAISALVLSNDGLVYTGSADKKIKIWKKQMEEKKHCLVATLERHKSAVNALALSPDGSVLYSGACDRSILVWEKDSGDAGGGQMVVGGALRGHRKAILCLAVVSDLVCSGSADNTVRIWRRLGTEKGSYSCLTVLEGHRKPVKCLTVTEAIESDNNGGADDASESCTSYLLYSGSLDCDIRIWHIQVPTNSFNS